MNKKIAGSIVIFSSIFGLNSLVQTEVITMDRYLYILIYLAIVAILFIFYFRNDLKQLVSQTSIRKAGLLLIISLGLHFVTVFAIKNFASQPIWPFDSRGASFLLMNNFYIWVKPLDVFVQQLMIVLLVLRLKKFGITLQKITYLFLLGFGIIHSFQLFNTDSFIALIFVVPAVVLSIVFPYMILRFKSGYIYNYMIHLALYNIVAMIAWFLY